LGAAPVWAEAGKANNAQASRIDGSSLCDTKNPYEYLCDSKTGTGIRLRACGMLDRPFSP
jgi:hypothetical protein